MPEPADAYLDHAASTAVRPEARAAVLDWFDNGGGNPSGAHRAARAARRALDDARDVIAEATGFGAGDVVFTGGGTEADNLAVLGVHDALGGRVLVGATEHPAVREPAYRRGASSIAVDVSGAIDLDHLADLVDPDVTLVSVMAVNNETGVVHDLPAVVDVVRRAAPDAIVHTDAIQAAGWLDLRHVGADVDLLTLSAHKFGGPQGVGVLVSRAGVPLRPQIVGGGQERDRRAGTQNVAGAVGTAAALAAADRGRIDTAARVRVLRDRLADGLRAAVPGLVETGVIARDRSRKVPGNCHVCIPGAEAEMLLLLLERDGVLASAASSCASGAQEPSHVLAAMGIDRRTAGGSLRLSLGWNSTDDDVDRALAAVPAAVDRLGVLR